MLCRASWFGYACSMILKEIAIDAIDLDNEGFRISEELDVPALRDSLSRIGQLNPLIIKDGEDGKAKSALVSGFRRFRAMKGLGWEAACARVVPAEENPLAAFELALWDNLSHRQLHELEKARALAVLRDVCGVSEELLRERYLPILGLPPRESLVRSFLKMNAADSRLRSCLAEGKLTWASAEALLDMPVASVDRFVSLMATVRLSASLQKKVIGLIEDLAAEGAAVLDGSEIAAIVADAALSPFQKGERVHDVLHRLHHPRLSSATDLFQRRREAIGLPGSIRISTHPYFETSGLKVEFEASDSNRFRHLVSALDEAARRPEFESLFEVE